MKELREIFSIESIKVQLRSECVGSHSGQLDTIIEAMIGGMCVGHLSYSIYNEEVSIQYVQVKQEYKKRGIAKQMFEYLMETEGILWDDIKHSIQTEEGNRMYRELHKIFHDPNFNGRPLKMNIHWSEMRDILWNLVERVEDETGIEIEYSEEWYNELMDIIKNIRYGGNSAHESVIEFLLSKPEIQDKMKEATSVSKDGS